MPRKKKKQLIDTITWQGVLVPLYFDPNDFLFKAEYMAVAYEYASAKELEGVIRQTLIDAVTLSWQEAIEVKVWESINSLPIRKGWLDLVNAL